MRALIFAIALALTALLPSSSVAGDPATIEELRLYDHALGRLASEGRVSPPDMRARMTSRVTRRANTICILFRTRRGDFEASYCYDRGPSGWAPGYEGMTIFN